MRIAAVTDDGKKICSHFGRARYFIVCQVDGGRILSRDMRSKAGHYQFAGKADGEQHHRREHHQSHGMGAAAKVRHASMIDTISDCEVLLAGGMGRGAYLALEEAGITPVITDELTIEDAVQACLNGEIVNHTERLH